jgi:hypothetical protein
LGRSFTLPNKRIPAFPVKIAPIWGLRSEMKKQVQFLVNKKKTGIQQCQQRQAEAKWNQTSKGMIFSSC